ncbi:class F sortase [Candidatus Saccharibacteria bacterium]|nr:class F sortase [Candidatus Saccharibacteria bacterium]
MRGHVKYYRFTRRRKSYGRVIFVSIYFLALIVYVALGFRPSADAAADNRLFIPAIDLRTPVKNIDKNGSKLDVPDDIAGAYNEKHNKTLIVGHSTTVFKNLSSLYPDDTFTFDGETYLITESIVVPKTSIDMAELLSAADEPTIIIMTCTGTPVSNTDTTHRLLITAVRR